MLEALKEIKFKVKLKKKSIFYTQKVNFLKEIIMKKEKINTIVL